MFIYPGWKHKNYTKFNERSSNSHETIPLKPKQREFHYIGTLINTVILVFYCAVCQKYKRKNSKTIKGIVSPDWKGLQMVSLDRFEV
jgi:hypothetical protein